RRDSGSLRTACSPGRPSIYRARTSSCAVARMEGDRRNQRRIESAPERVARALAHLDEIGRQWRLERELLSVPRQRELQAPGVERPGPAGGGHGRVLAARVLALADQRGAGVREVQADLVLAPGDELEFELAGHCMPGEHPVQRAR